MQIKTSAKTLPAAYFQLVERFPLTHIRNDNHLKAAQKMVDALLEERLDRGGREYLDALTDLVETYEATHETFADASEADVLRELMRANGFSQPRLAKEIGIAQSTISAVLNEARSLTREQVVRLARFFHVSPAAFLPDSAS